MRLLFFVFLLFPFLAIAEDYYWTGGVTSGSYVFQWRGDDPVVGCQEFASSRSTTVNSTNYFGTGTRLSCVTNAPSSPSSVTFFRYGNECPSGTTYNPETYKCDAPEEDICAPTVGQDFIHEYDAGLVSSDTPPSLPPSNICNSSCSYSRTNTVKGCNRYLETSTGKSLDTLYCQVSYVGTGSSCTTNNPPPGSVFDQPPSKPPSDATPASINETSCTDWVTNADGTITRSCTSTNQFKDPGNIKCEAGSTSLTCVSANPPTRFEETKKTEDVTKTTNPDGSAVTDTSTTTDKTLCQGIKPCTSTSANEESSSETNPDGTPGETTESCTGSGCPDEEGKTQEEREEEEEEKSSVNGEQCGVPVACQGDAVQCAILRQQKEQRCSLEEAMDYESNKAAIEQMVTGDEYQVEEETFQIPSFATEATRFLPSSGCPAPARATLKSGATVEMDYGPFCTFAEGISPVVVISALLFAAIFVTRGLGGA
jgi:hypothetical protein